MANQLGKFLILLAATLFVLPVLANSNLYPKCGSALKVLDEDALNRMEKAIRASDELQKPSPKSIYILMSKLLANEGYYDFLVFVRDYNRLIQENAWEFKSLQVLLKIAFAFEREMKGIPNDPVDFEQLVADVIFNQNQQYKKLLENQRQAMENQEVLPKMSQAVFSLEFRKSLEESPDSQKKKFEILNAHFDEVLPMALSYFAETVKGNWGKEGALDIDQLIMDFRDDSEFAFLFYEDMLVAFELQSILLSFESPISKQEWDDFLQVLGSKSFEEPNQTLAKKILLMIDGERLQEISEDYSFNPPKAILAGYAQTNPDMDVRLIDRGTAFEDSKNTRFRNINGRELEIGVPSRSESYLQKSAYDTGFYSRPYGDKTFTEDFFKYLQKKFPELQSGKSLRELRLAVEKDPAAIQVLRDMISAASYFMVQEMELKMEMDHEVKESARVNQAELPDNYYSFKWDTWLEIAFLQQKESKYLQKINPVLKELVLVNELLNFDRFAFDPYMPADHIAPKKTN